jgi:hypothetical protein
MTRRDGFVLHAVAATVTLLILAPLLLPGYVLSYDMVFVPHQALLWDLIAPTGALPRAVPEDAVVSLLNQVVPGWLLQRVALVGLVYAAALGAGRLVPARRLLTRLVSAVLYAWTPFLAERLLLGQWALLLAYAGLPWLVAGALRLRSEPARGASAGEPRRLRAVLGGSMNPKGGAARVVVAAAACAIAPTGAVIALVITVVLCIPRNPVQRWGPAVAGVVLLNLPWVAAGLATAASGRTDPAGVAAFSARGENWAGPLTALAGTGGAWNALTTPQSRSSVVVPVVTLVLLVLAVLGIAPLRRRWPVGLGSSLLVLAGVSFVVAALGVLPGSTAALEWLVHTVPGSGLLRDGQKFLIPYVLALSLTVALGAERLVSRVGHVRGQLVLGALVLLPVVAMPDLALGAAGTLRPVSYPADWDRVAAIVAEDPGRVVSLPFNPYRSFAWNYRRTVLDPATRYLPAPVVTDDELVVGTVQIAGDDPQAAQVRAVLDAGQPLARTGARWVLVERNAGGDVPDGALSGLTRIYAGTTLDLYANSQSTPEPAPDPARRWLLGISDLLAALALIWGLASVCGMPTPW